MDTYIIANNNLNAFKALNLNDIELIKEDMLFSQLPPLKGDLIYTLQGQLIEAGK